MSIDRGRLRATWALAESCLDHLPQARQPSDLLGGSAGLAESRQTPCTACGARGRVRGPGVICTMCEPQVGPTAARAPSNARALHGCYPCLVCEGTGWRRRRKNDAPIDGYAGVEVQPADKAEDISVGAMRRTLADDRERPEKREQAIRRTQRVLDEYERPESLKFGWEDRWERMCGMGSYAELMVALEVLRQKDEPRYSIIWQIVCLQQPIRLSESRQAYLNESMTILAALMPERIRVPYYLRPERRNELRKESLWRGRSPAHERERRERDALIVELRVNEGWKTKRLCEHFALSRAQVKKIIAAAVVADEGSQT